MPSSYTFIQEVENSVVDSTPSISTPSMTVIAGDLLIAATEGDDRYAGTALTDSQNHIWTPLCTVDDVPTHIRDSLYMTIAKGGSTVFSAASGGGSGMGVAVAEYSSPGALLTLSGLQYAVNILQPNLGNDSYSTPFLGCSGPVLLIGFSRVFSGGPLAAGVLPNAFTRRAPVWLPLSFITCASFEDVLVPSGDAKATFSGDASNQYNRVNIMAVAFSLSSALPLIPLMGQICL